MTLSDGAVSRCIVQECLKSIAKQQGCLLIPGLVTRGHFRSCDKDGGHTIRSAVAENPILHANLMAFCFIEPELRLIEVFLHCGNRDFLLFLLL